MRSAPHLFNEDARLAALAEYQLANAEPHGELDDVVQIASRLFDVPIVMVSVIERHRQFVKAKVGLDVCEIERRTSFCAHALGGIDLMVVPDARLDIRFADNPFVTGEPHIRFYAGVPLRSPDGQSIGTLCIIDRKPRNGLSPDDEVNLLTLAKLVLDKLEMRRLAVAGAVSQSRFQNIAATSPDGIICADHDGNVTFWNAAAEQLFGFTAQQALGRGIDLIVPERMRGGHGGGLRRVAGGGKPHLVGTTVTLNAAHADGHELPVELSLSMWHEGDRASFGAIIRDISERRANEERLFNLAHLDSLTGLPNRTVLMNRLTDLARSSEPCAVLMIDLDGFKDVNDTLGHTAGDAVLVEVAHRVLGCTKPTDTVARLGGDEFAMILSGTDLATHAALRADCIIDALAKPVHHEDRVVHVSASVGIALYPRDGEHAEDLLSAADLAMYQAKAEGRDCRRFFTPLLREVAVQRHAFEGELRGALERNEFRLFYQPQVDAATGAMIGVEALLRWQHPTAGLLTPDRFLSSIESGSCAAEIGRWVLEQACRDAVELRRTFPALTVGVNLFGAQFRTGRLADEVAEVLAETGLPAAALELEITENIILRHDETMLRPLLQLRERGVGIAFDDFGTGFASLSLLKRYPISRIKIDRSFVRDICDDAADRAIVTATIYLAGQLGLDVIAEGVETEAQRDLVRACGCHTIQGYLYGQPVPIGELGSFAEDAELRGQALGRASGMNG